MIFYCCIYHRVKAHSGCFYESARQMRFRLHLSFELIKKGAFPVFFMVFSQSGDLWLEELIEKNI